MVGEISASSQLILWWKPPQARSFITLFLSQFSTHCTTISIGYFCYKLISDILFTNNSQSHLHLIIARVGQSLLRPAPCCRTGQHKLLEPQVGDKPSRFALSLSMKSSYECVNRKCDCEEIFATYPPGFDFPVDESAGECSTTNVGIVEHDAMSYMVGGAQLT